MGPLEFSGSYFLANCGRFIGVPDRMWASVSGCPRWAAGVLGRPDGPRGSWASNGGPSRYRRAHRHTGPLSG